MNYNFNRKIVVFILILATYLFIKFIYFSPDEDKAKKNEANLKKITQGMTKDSVINIMGSPDGKRLSFLNSIDTMYYYTPRFGSSNGIYIQFDENDSVNQIVDNE